MQETNLLMRRLFAGVCFAMIMFVAARAQDPGFSQVVKPDDFTAAGLSKLTPEELARLNQLVQDYKSGALQAARQQAADAEARATQAEAEARAAKEAATNAEKAKDQAVAQANEAKKDSGGFFEKAKAILKPGTKVEFEPLESRILGSVIGWDEHTVFTLENGQTWQVSNFTHYFNGRAIESPKVTIKPAKLVGFEMTIEGMGSVRVRLVGEGVVHGPPPAQDTKP